MLKLYQEYADTSKINFYIVRSCSFPKSDFKI